MRRVLNVIRCFDGMQLPHRARMVRIRSSGYGNPQSLNSGYSRAINCGKSCLHCSEKNRASNRSLSARSQGFCTCNNSVLPATRTAFLPLLSTRSRSGRPSNRNTSPVTYCRSTDCRSSVKRASARRMKSPLLRTKASMHSMRAAVGADTCTEPSRRTRRLMFLTLFRSSS